MDKNVDELEQSKKAVIEKYSDEIEERKFDVSDLETRLKIELQKIDDEIAEVKKLEESKRIELLRKLNHHFTINKKSEVSQAELPLIYDFVEYLKDAPEHPKLKIALMFICLNEPYWQYTKQVINGARKHFVPWHDVDYLLWTDIPKNPQDISDRINRSVEIDRNNIAMVQDIDRVIQDVTEVVNSPDVEIFPTESIQWPAPTLMRYHKFLDQEEKLKEYDYVFYCDIDMMFVDLVGDEILGDGLTVAHHPMYALKSNFNLPTEPNPESTAYIKYTGTLDLENKKFNHVYAAGGFQGGKTHDFIRAMKVMRDNINADYANNYVARWNDESHWNRYLYDNPEEISVVLSPSYVYPDSLIKEYYEPIWGRSYVPRLVTLTKKFTTSQEGAEAIKTTLEQMQKLK